MRAVFAVTLALMCGVALATSGANDAEVSVETDAEHPVLPALGSPCLPKRQRRNWRVAGPRPKVFRGVCTAESACPNEQAEPGYCAGIGVTCCKHHNQPQSNGEPQTYVHADEKPAAAAPVLRSGTSACQTQGGTCGAPAACTASGGRTQSGLCPGAGSNVCCFKGSPPPTATKLDALVKIPAGINRGLTIAGAKGLNAKIGQPGCPLTAACFSCTCAISNRKITNNRVTLQITPNFKLTGLKPFVDAVKRAFDAIKARGATDPVYARVYNEAKTAGGLCCRPIKRSNGTPGSTWSNHSWGAAADFYFGADIDPRGDGKTQYGLALMADFMAAEKLYWAAGYSGSEEDAMHFEASSQALATWTLA